MNRDDVQVVMTYVIALLILSGAFVLIYQNIGDTSQAWLAVGLVAGYVFRDAGGNAAARNAAKVADATNAANIANGGTGATGGTPSR